LASTGRKEQWVDINERPPKGIVEKTVKKGIEPKSLVRIIFSGPFEWSRHNRYELESLADVLRMKLREILREDLGGTYGVSVGASPSRYPVALYRINIGFGCSPDRLEELTEMVFQQIDSLKNEGIAESYVSKVKEMDLRRRETNLKENRFWLNRLFSFYTYDEDPGNILKYDQLVATLSSESIKNAAQKYFNTMNYVKVYLTPENID